MTQATPISVMVVDDSASIRGRIFSYFEHLDDVAIVATATQGQMALERLGKQPVEVLVMDLSMPEKDALQTLPDLRQQFPDVKVLLMVSPDDDRDRVMQAMSGGVAELVTKPMAQAGKNDVDAFHQELDQKIRELAHSPTGAITLIHSTMKDDHSPQIEEKRKRIDESPTDWHYPDVRPSAIAIGSSTGGPPALMELFKGLRGFTLPVPVFLTQHMPADFTSTLSSHLSTASGRLCHEAADDMPVARGEMYLAPGDYHMGVRDEKGGLHITLNQEPPENFCRPAVDVMLRSLSAYYGNRLFVIMLTGMGQDGLIGCKAVTGAGGSVIAQNKESSVVWGMPRVVAEAGLCLEVLPLACMADYVRHMMRGGA